MRATEVKKLIAERDRLEAVGKKFGLRLTGFDHLGSQYYAQPNATFADTGNENSERVTLPYWLIDRLKG